MKKTSLKKIFLALFVAFEVFTLNMPVVYAFGLGSIGGAIGGALGGVGGALGGSVLGNAAKVDIGAELSKVESRYHIDTGAMQNLGETLNVSTNKGYAPEVRVLFSPQDPQPGQKITARAFAQFFTNTTDSLYFTWYLKRQKCVDENRSFAEINGTVENSEEGCDYDGNGTYDINDMKVEAARVLAGDGFDVRYQADQQGGDDDDNDGYVAFPGGDSKRNATETVNPYYYYLHDFNSGRDYEIIDEIASADIFPECADEDKVPVCIANSALVCSAKQITKSIDRDRELEITATATGEGGEGGTDGAAGASGTATSDVTGEQASTTIITTNINQSDNQFDICGIVGAPVCQSFQAQVGLDAGVEDAGIFDLPEEMAGKPACAGSATPVCVDPAALGYTIEQLRERTDNLNALDGWSYAAFAYDTPADPKVDGYVVEPSGIFTDFQCTDKDIHALVSFWPPPDAPAATIDAPITAEELNEAQDAVDIYSDVYVLDDYYSCEAELYGREYKGVVSSGKDILDEGDIIETCNPQEISADSFQRFHLFSRNTEGAQVGESEEDGGDEGFGVADELFYHTDPFDQDTADNRVNDEATVVGLGQDSFSWIYTPGDEVGVIVEGTSMNPTKHPDSSSMIMFATVNNACDYVGMINNSIVSTTGEYQVRIQGYDVTIPAIAFEEEGGGAEGAFNACLSTSENAFVTPAQGGAAKKLEIDLSVTPENPVNDPLNSQLEGADIHVNMGDTVTVSSTITNAKYKGDRLRYTWSLWKSKDGSADFDPTNWRLIAGSSGNEDTERGMFGFPEAEITPLIGNGLSELSFKLNIFNDAPLPPLAVDDSYNTPGLFNSIDDNFTYLRARVSVEEDFDLLAQELHEYDVSRGRADVIFRVSRASNKLRVYTITDAAQTQNVGGLLTCEDEPGQLAKCPVVKNQLLKIVLDDQTGDADYTNYRWKLDNKPLYKPAGFKCLGTDTDVSESVCNFLPITGEPGTEYVVTVSANSIGKVGDAYGSGQAVEVTKKFVVVEPYVSFCDERPVADDLTTGIAQCQGLSQKPVSTYTSDTETKTEYSKVVFLAPPASLPTIFGSPRPRWIAGQTEINWFMEGVYQDGVGGLFTVDGSQKNPGESTNVIAKAVYQPAKSVRDLMRSTWNHTDQQLMPIHFESPAQIEYAENAPVALSAPAAFLAALSVNAPGTVLFLFRVFLAVGVAVFLVGLLWYVVPETTTRPRL